MSLSPEGGLESLCWCCRRSPNLCPETRGHSTANLFRIPDLGLSVGFCVQWGNPPPGFFSQFLNVRAGKAPQKAVTLSSTGPAPGITDFMQLDSFWGSCTDLTLSWLEVSAGGSFVVGLLVVALQTDFVSAGFFL